MPVSVKRLGNRSVVPGLCGSEITEQIGCRAQLLAP